MFNFKKIASVASSAVMVMSTVGLAAAVNFPAPFVQNGQADVAVVYGSGFLDMISEKTGKRGRLRPVIVVDSIYIQIKV